MIFNLFAPLVLSFQETMADLATLSKPPLPKQLLTQVSNCDGPPSPPLQGHFPICKSEPICLEEESPTALPSVCTSTHRKGKESPVNSTIYSLGANQCFHCLITFPDEKFKERHMKREHPEDFVQANLRDALFVCFICNKAFKGSRALICHQRGHAPPPPSDCNDCLRPNFDCPDCGRRFGQLANYQRHRLGHATGHSLPHHCPDCGKSFRQLSNLRRHQAFHQQTQELLPSRPYSCMECGESFTQEAGLHEHYIRHARGEL